MLINHSTLIGAGIPAADTNVMWVSVTDDPSFMLLMNLKTETIIYPTIFI